ncbi:ABC transporter, substrate-binding protein, aliphatic sulfonates family [Anaeromyxobacter dehalogenans 2CP-1]|uniref:ABC transporter, substrate-binding protein, aliphatic sulfonates family n=1 Tax=Anaeromyxobacter dehalogenans (strain ATCC BAA-258 / DSM 21875 / 2CP-1) TaxID=455488 RepID=B8J9R9_ANAD2|nr:ABC transporter substrate-binding protein [Anaeromyxobacter dehalogenans]ACL67457.1 ABC transporter, substrate-binding protein, aliphatic sulfonates family [Anaeromyxobacter dehalogenans 2CP-1]
MRRSARALAALVTLGATLLAAPLACRRGGDAATRPLRVGHFPNLTHAQALVGFADGTFSRALGGRVEAKQFNAGPGAIEALASGDLDAAYVGPGPATVAYLRTRGDLLRVVAGATSGGAVLVVRDARRAADLAGQRVASPQLGNTQDVALRTWLSAQGLRVGDGPGQVRVYPVANAEILGLFARGELAGAWVPEPWGARLVAEAGARILVDERTLWEGGRFPTAVLAVSRRALETRRADVLALVRAHLELTRRWERDREAFARAANAAFGALTGKPLPEPVLHDAFSRIDPASDPMAAQLALMAEQARALGFAPAGDVSGMVDGSLLQELSAR